MDNTAIERNTLIGYARALTHFRTASPDIINYCLSMLEKNDYEGFESLFKKRRRQNKVGSYIPIRKGRGGKLSNNVQTIALGHFFKRQELANDIAESGIVRLSQFFDAIGSLFEEKYQAHKVLPKIRKLASIFGLDKNECDILTFKYLYSINSELAEALDDLLRTSSRYENENTFLQHLLGVTNKEILKYFSTNSILEEHGLLQRGTIDENVAGFLLDDSASSFLSYLCTKSVKKAFPLDSFSVDKQIAETAVAILSNIDNARILIHGASGTGKTEFAKSLVNQCGRQPYFVNDPKNVYLAAATLAKGKEVVIADEVDDMLNESNPMFRDEIKKGGINQKIDIMERQCIFISNSISEIDESVLRRFHFIMEFKELSVSERASMWAENIKPLTKIINEDEVITYAQKYRLSLGITAQSATAAVKCGQSKEERRVHFETLMDSHDKTCNGVKKNMKANAKFSVDILNTCTNLNLLLNYANKCAEKMKNGDGVRCSMLFHGVPGTGKTEFAKYIAEFLKIEPYVVKISDIKSMWVGGTEKNICNAFRRAEERGEMLIFDEADSMLHSRENAHVAWERDEVNEFLSMMDTYKGFMACTTNHLATLDTACLRRFSWKVEFKPLLKHQLMKAVSYYFPKVDFSEYENTVTSLEDITAGDIAVVAAANMFGENGVATEIIALLEHEAKYKKQSNKDKIGF